MWWVLPSTVNTALQAARVTQAHVLESSAPFCSTQPRYVRLVTPNS